MHNDSIIKARTTILLAIVTAMTIAMVFALGWTRTALADDMTAATIDNAVLSEMTAPAIGGTPSPSCTLTVNFANDYYPNEGDPTRSIEVSNTALEWSEDGQHMTEGGKFSVDHRYTVSPGVLFSYNTTKHTGFADNKAKVLVANVARGEISLGQSPSGSQQISFPAQWTLREVRYHGNADDVTGTMGKQAFYQEDGVTLSPNTFKRSDHTFLGWSTTSNGKVKHADKANIKPESSLDLYAQWTADSYTITFKNDDGTELQKGKVAYNTMPQYTGKAPTKAATDKVTYTFKGWTPEIVAATADATYTATYTETPSPAPKTATLTFDPAGGTYEGKTDKFTVTATVGETIKLPGAPTRDGYTFKFWKGSEYDAGADYKVEGDHAFTAEWTKNEAPAATFTITFNANGGTGTMDDLVGESGSKVTLTANKFTRSGYTFSGWNTKKDGTGTSYKDKDSIEPTGDLTLYAQWTKNTTDSTTQTSTSTATRTSTSTTTRTPTSTATRTPTSTTTRTSTPTTTRTSTPTTSSTKSGTTSSTLAKTGDDTTSLIPAAVLALSGGAFALSRRTRRL